MIEIRETHISWVILTETEVFKIKKPINLGFLDYTSVESRKSACQAEVTLNSRLAHGVYRGAVPITREGAVVDWAVQMERLPDEKRGDQILKSEKLSPTQLDALAELLSRFHAEALCNSETDAFGKPALIRSNLDENFDQTRHTLETYLTPSEARELRDWQYAFLETYEELLNSRIAHKRVRDGHGDLRLEQIYFLPPPQGITVIDCIEFNSRFRYADVACDLAFLSMDLRFRGRPDLAEHLLAAYARQSNDFDLYEVIDFYESYRAFVRGKVATFLAADTEAPALLRAQAHRDAKDYFQLSWSKTHPPLTPPTVVAVAGILGSGKSTVAEALSQELSLPIVDSDRTRKWLLGVGPTEPIHHKPWQGAYSSDVSQRVLSEGLRRIAAVLASGRSVIVDATFRSLASRSRLRDLAQAHGAAFLLIECQAPFAVCRARLIERQSKTGVSDGRVEIFDEFISRVEPVTELAEEEHIRLDTGKKLPETLDSLSAQLKRRPRGLKAA